jgi:hypothetical protein
MTTASNVHTVKGGAVRLTIPAKVAFNLDELTAVLKKAAERLGHPACATGCDVFQILQEREFVATDKAELNPQPLPPRTQLLKTPDPDGDPALTVTIPAKVSGDINNLTKAVSLALGKLGCPTCCSGFDILFRRETDMLAIDEKLNVAGFGRFR